MRVERSGYMVSERVRRVWERLSRSSCISPVAFVLSGGVEAAVDERGRRDFVDMLLQHCPNLQANSSIPQLLHQSLFQARGKSRHPDWRACIEMKIVDDSKLWELRGEMEDVILCQKA